ncbi:MAG: Tat pathway signal sequence domain protein [Alphaproteobacteria bacterium]|nr:Tat pathway signal sequence domain protein [Alphaproteobacteria bacterium]
MTTALAMGLPLPALASEAGLSIELNKLESRESGCRAYLVLQNDTEQLFSSLKLDLFLFDGDGVIARRVALQAAPLDAAKTIVKVFDLKGQRCDGIGQLLLNDVSECVTGQGAVEGCVRMITTRSRAEAPFIK